MARLTRRNFVAMAAARALFAFAAEPRLAVTMDDVNWQAIPQPLFDGANARILAALKSRSLQAALFPVGRYIDNQTGRAILDSWSDAGHIVGNHTYSHLILGPNTGETAFEEDILHAERVLDLVPRYRKFFRYPALKEGDTAGKRDGVRSFLRLRGYRTAYVTIDTSDWYYDARLRARIKQDPSFDVSRYRQPYLDHMWDRAVYYDGLARRVLGHPVAHTLLVHYNLLNSLFLGDVLEMYSGRGWKLIDAESAFSDPVFDSSPRTLPAGESLIWALAKETGRFDNELRYPGEDDIYEKPKLDRLGL